MKESAHFLAMLRERSILREWVDRALNNPDRVNEPNDGTKHCMKKIAENGNRWLRVIINIEENPNKFITVFFDRRLGREL
jgi:hypothetical protein